MNKKEIIPVLILVVAFLAGCTSTVIRAQVTSTTTEASHSALSTAELAAGTIGLQATSNAVSADQASVLIPLWLAYKEVNTSDTGSAEESDALVVQITSTMTSDQIVEIQAMNLTTADMEALTGITAGQTTKAASFSGNQATPAGALADGGMMGGDMGAGEAPSDASQMMASTNSQNKQVTDDLVLSLVEPLTEMLRTIPL